MCSGSIKNGLNWVSVCESICESARTRGRIDVCLHGRTRAHARCVCVYVYVCVCVSEEIENATLNAGKAKNIFLSAVDISPRA